MFLKVVAHMSRNIKFIPSIIERKCASSLVPGFRLLSQENNINFIKSKFYSRDERPNYGFNSEEKAKLQKWINMIKFEGGRVPKEITDEQLFDLFSLTSESQRINHLNYLYVREIAKYKFKANKERKKELKRNKMELRNERPKGHIEYGLWKNTMFAKTNKHHFKSLQNYKLCNAVMHNQPLIIDLDFYDQMERREVTSIAEQLKYSICYNRSDTKPFNLTFCNVDFDCKKYQCLYKFMPNMSKPNFPIEVTSDSYLDRFPKEKLVYLTPNAKDEMKEFDHDAIYIIGGLVDLKNPAPTTLGKAKREDIKTMKLPIDKYHIVKRSQELAIHVMVKVLLELQKNGDFKKAFKNIPRRLLFTSDESHVEAYDFSKMKKF